MPPHSGHLCKCLVPLGQVKGGSTSYYDIHCRRHRSVLAYVDTVPTGYHVTEECGV